MSDFYDDLDVKKKRHKLNNKDLGDLIGMSADAFRMAVNRKKLSALEIREIQKYFKRIESPVKETVSDPLTDALIEKLFASEKFMKRIDERIDEKNREIAMLLLNDEIGKTERLIEKLDKKNVKG